MLSVNEVAADLGVEIKKVYRLIHAGLLPAVNVSPDSRKPTYRVDEQALREFKEKNRV